MKKLGFRLGAVLVMAGALSAASTTVTGTLSKQSGKFVMVEDATNARFEVRGKGLEKLVGSHVKVTGELLDGAIGSTPVVELSSATKVSAAASKTAAAGMKTGAAKSTLIVVGSVAGGGAVAGLYAADVVGGDEEPASRR